MAKTVTIKLREPIIGHEGAINKLVLRPPTLPEYMLIGELYTFVPAGEERYAAIRNDAAFVAYANVLVVEPSDKLLLTQVQLADAMDVEKEIEGFFAAARLARQSPTSLMPSSSTSN